MQYDEHKLVEYFADAPAGVGFSDLDLNNIPHHISCIMDGNGRWATSRGLARTEGHKAGIVSLREIITACVRLGVDVLSDAPVCQDVHRRAAASEARKRARCLFG